MNDEVMYTPPTVVTYEIEQLTEQVGAARAFSEAAPEEDLFGTD